MSTRKYQRVWMCFFGSERLRGKSERRRARRDIRAGIEPAPRYATGKFWTD